MFAILSSLKSVCGVQDSIRSILQTIITDLEANCLKTSQVSDPPDSSKAASKLHRAIDEEVSNFYEDVRLCAGELSGPLAVQALASSKEAIERSRADALVSLQVTLILRSENRATNLFFKLL